jgi:beta-lactamase regulating signal transducer with metallopeptidase domain/tetratricopeptide (TPR) repeat protein
MNTILEQINSAGLVFVEFAVPMLIQSAVLILVLLLADLLLRKKVRAVFRYWLWMLVLLKLVLPTTLSSPVSLGSRFGDELAGIKVSDVGIVAQPVNLQQITETAAVKSMPLADTKPTVTHPSGAKLEVAGPPLAPPTPLTWQGIVFLVWAAVVVAMGLLLLQRAIFVTGLVAQAQSPTQLMNDTFRFCCGQMGIKGKVSLKVSANTASPAVCGLFRPVILVPQNLALTLGSSRLRPVLLHELAHIRRGDLWINLVQTVLQIIYFYNPLLWLANSIIRRIREQAVDEAVQVAMGANASQYPQTLLDVAKIAFKRPALSLRLIGVVESKSALKGRIERMLNRPIPKSAKLSVLGLITLLIFAAVFLPMAKAKSKPPKFLIKGAVSDATTGRPVCGAKVGDDKYAEGKQWTTTDANGYYSYNTWYEEHNIKCEASGYKTQNSWFGTKLFGSEKEKVIDFALEPSDNSENTNYSSVTVEEGVGFDDIIVGGPKCTGEFIKSKLGEPDNEIKNEKVWWLDYGKTYGLDFWVNAQKDVLEEIRFNKGFKGKLTSGISMSSTEQDVFNIYGRPVSEEEVEDLFVTKSIGDRVLFKKSNRSSRFLWTRTTDGPIYSSPVVSTISKIYYDTQGLIFWFSGNIINQIVVFQKSDYACSKFKATLPNGVTVKLIGVCEHPSEGKQWWWPDGTALEKAPYVSRKGKPIVNSNEEFNRLIEIAVGLSGTDLQDVSLYCKVLGATRTSVNGVDIEGLKSIACEVSKLTSSGQVNVGVATGWWETIDVRKAIIEEKIEEKVNVRNLSPGHWFLENNGGFISWDVPLEKDGKASIKVAHSYGEYDSRVVARDRNGNLLISSWSSGGGADAIHTTEYKFPVKLAGIDEFQLQMRPYQWVEFKNVSFQPSLKTDVQVERTVGGGQQQSVEDLPKSLMERRDILQKKLKTAEMEYNAGRAGSKQLMQAKIDLLWVESKLSETPQKRIDILEQIVNLYLEQEKATKLLLEAGRMTQDELNELKLPRLNAEEELARAKADLEKSKSQKTNVQVEIEEAGKVTDKDKMASENLAAQGWQLWRQRKLPEAEEAFEKAVSKDPTNANAWNGLGWAQQNQSKPLNAKASFEKCLEIQPKHAAALNGLGWIAKAQGKTDEAIAHWEKAVKATPTATAALNGLATTYMELNRFDKAAKYYQMWLKVEPDNADAKTGLEKTNQMKAFHEQHNPVVSVYPSSGSKMTLFSELQVVFDQPMMPGEFKIVDASLEEKFENFSDVAVVRSYVIYDADKYQFSIPLILPCNWNGSVQLSGFKTAKGVEVQPIVLNYTTSKDKFSDDLLQMFEKAKQSKELRTLLENVKNARSNLKSLSETVHYAYDFGDHEKSSKAIFKMQGSRQFYVDMSKEFEIPWHIGSDGQKCWFYNEHMDTNKLVATDFNIVEKKISICNPFEIAEVDVDTVVKQNNIEYLGTEVLDGRRCHKLRSWLVKIEHKAICSVITWWFDSETYMPTKIVSDSGRWRESFRFVYDSINEPINDSEFRPDAVTKIKPQEPEPLDENYNTRYVRIIDGSSSGRMSVRWGKRGPKGTSGSGLN